MGASIPVNLYDEAAKLAEADRPEDAVRILLPMLDDDFDDPRTLFILGFTFLKTEKYGLAYQILRRAVDIYPHEAAMWHNLAKCCYERQRYDDAENYFRRALKLKPDFVNSLDGLALVNLNRSEYGLAIEYANRALKESPELMDPMVNRGMAYLALKRWREGWDGYNRNLGLNKDRKERIYGEEKRWDGKSGLRIVVYGEQGIGDELSFASVLPDVIADSSSVAIECDRRIEGIFRRSFPQCEVRGTRYKDRPGFLGEKLDARVAIGELPGFYRNADEDFPGTPYLIPDPLQRLQWRAALDSLGRKPKIGIAWSGGRPHTGAPRRSVTLETLLPLFRAIDADWISLQYESPAAEIEAFEETHGIKIHHWPHGVESYDYDATFALLAELDLVISVTTTVVHAAGAIGKECWCLVPSKVMWRYLNAGSWFPWAKSVTLFRQKGREWPIHILAGMLKDKFAPRNEPVPLRREAAGSAA